MIGTETTALIEPAYPTDLFYFVIQLFIDGYAYIYIFWSVQVTEI